MKKCIKRIFSAVIMGVISLTAISAYAQQSAAAKQLSVIANKLSNAKTLTASFTCSGNGQSSTGSLTLKGDKFIVAIDKSITIYNGKEVWQANEFSREINIFYPDDDMLAEINPIALISQSTGDYKATALKAPEGMIKLSLTPVPVVAAHSNVKKIVLSASKSTNLPTEAIVEIQSGEVLNFKFHNIKIGEQVADTLFRLDKNKYPGYQLVDLRD